MDEDSNVDIETVDSNHVYQPQAATTVQRIDEFHFQANLRQIGSLEQPYIKPDPYLEALSQFIPVEPTELSEQSNRKKRKEVTPKATDHWVRRSTRETNLIEKFTSSMKIKTREPLTVITNGVIKEESSDAYDNRWGVLLCPATETQGALFLGNEDVAKNALFIGEVKIESIVNVSERKKDPPKDSSEQSLDSLEVNAAMNTVREHRAAGKMGRSRSVAVTCMYMIIHEGRSLKECVDILASCNVKIQLNEGFKQQLMLLDERIHGKPTYELLQTDPMCRELWKIHWQVASAKQNKPDFRLPPKRRKGPGSGSRLRLPKLPSLKKWAASSSNSKATIKTAFVGDTSAGATQMPFSRTVTADSIADEAFPPAIPVIKSLHCTKQSTLFQYQFSSVKMEPFSPGFMSEEPSPASQQMHSEEWNFPQHFTDYDLTVESMDVDQPQQEHTVSAQ